VRRQTAVFPLWECGRGSFKLRVPSSDRGYAGHYSGGHCALEDRQQLPVLIAVWFGEGWPDPAANIFNVAMGRQIPWRVPLSLDDCLTPALARFPCFCIGNNPCWLIKGSILYHWNDWGACISVGFCREEPQN